MLRIEQLTKYYGANVGVKDISLELKSGEIFGFIGPNGAGKSTTIRCIMNLINKTSGKVYVDNKLFLRNDTEVMKKIGYLPSEISMYDDLTVKNAIKYTGSFYDNFDFGRADSLATRLELDTSKRIEQLSLGNLKKLGIVISLMHSPSLVIMDEATSGLDPLMQDEFYAILKEEKERGTTVFFSSHNLPEVRKICDRIGIIKDGTLKKVDTVSNLTDGNVCIVTLMCDDMDFISKIADTVIEKNSEHARFTYSGNINELVKELAVRKITKLHIEEPSVEDIFMHYYQ